MSIKSHLGNKILVLVISMYAAMLMGCKPHDDGNAPTPPNSGVAETGGETPTEPTTPPTPDDRNPKPSGAEVSVMTFNVENMFDNVHNEGVGDWTYLPLSEKNASVKKECATMGSYEKDCLTRDWRDDVVEAKLANVAKVIKSVDNGKGPDNLFLVEVENINILNQLVNTHLKGLGYQTIRITTGPDPRGINVAFISKFPQVGQPVTHIIPYTSAGGKKSRGILEVTVKINNKNVTFLSNHFPSLSNPTSWRVEAYAELKRLMKEMQDNGRAVIAGGDFNTSPEEEANNGFFGQVMSQVGAVSHLVGCQACEGTYYYRGNWQFLDALIYSHNLDKVGGLSFIPESISIPKVPGHVNADGRPFHYDAAKKEGASDHLPVYSRLRVLN